ncbi:cell cycle checkpoint protein RAD17 [Histomonas meleagridis]|uniref:cell cycle checkpoint protein RAD17 n=1 Tax=Histomonas meleagridis TaxID=135588 RepID=UPI00355A1E37|nr:cell cycle checkpoint protein RAD17 [Histomonas meleagridis]KAH0804138.1 cell cycle checkpoint protein RAD17 [Histomonas meleagridis]
MTILKDAYQGFPYYPRVIVMYGPVGCGKSTLVQAVCNYNHQQIISFSPDEEYYQSDDDLYAKNKVPIFIKQFEAFLEHSQLVTNPENQNVLLVDNVVIEDDSKRYFIDLIEKYSTDKRKLFPLIWIVDSSNSSISPNNCITFNYPAASHSVLKRVLLRVSKSEGIKLTNQQIEDILIDNPGDVRLAVNTLQFSRTFSTGKYDSLTFFQAVGEVLYVKNKRSSEQILQISHCSPRQMINSLYENSLTFYQSLEDYFEAADNFSIADELMSVSWQYPELGELAATTAMRGIMVSNMHKTPNTFLSLRSSNQSRLRNHIKIDPDTPFKCWPHLRMASNQMDMTLFSNDIESKFVHHQNKQDVFEYSIEELEQAMQMLELDPIETDGIDEFFGN